MPETQRLSYTYAMAVAKESVQELELVRSIAHHGEAGRAREGVLRRFLQRLCPPGLGVDTGFVIDGAGDVSGQVDLVLYRPHYYPVLEIGGVKHFPVESVIAVFEIKATMDSDAKLLGALGQIESVKLLDRTGGGSNYTLQPMGRKVDPDVFYCQVFGAVLAERSLLAESAVEAVETFCEGRSRRLWPNMVVAATDYSIRYIAPNKSPTEDATIAVGIAASGPAQDAVPPLADVAVALANIVRVSAPVDYSPSRYFPCSMNHLVQRPLNDDRFPGRKEAGSSLGDI